MSHTPGPWTVTKLIPVNTVENDYPGAEISWREIEGGIGAQKGYYHDAAVQVWSERAEANARLIAAAPEMLDALHQIMHASVGLAAAGIAGHNRVLGIASIAIAKAEGR